MARSRNKKKDLTEGVVLIIAVIITMDRQEEEAEILSSVDVETVAVVILMENTVGVEVIEVITVVVEVIVVITVVVAEIEVVAIVAAAAETIEHHMARTDPRVRTTTNKMMTRHLQKEAEDSVVVVAEEEVLVVKPTPVTVLSDELVIENAEKQRVRKIIMKQVVEEVVVVEKTEAVVEKTEAVAALVNQEEAATKT